MSNSKTEPMLSVAEVFEMTPGDEEKANWINPGFTAVVAEIRRSQNKKTGGPMNICTLRDTVGSATISMTVWNAIKFEEGDQIDVAGKGLRRTTFNGLEQVTLGKGTEIHVVGKSVHHDEQKQLAAEGKPALNGKLQPVNGQTVGMAMKEALVMVARGDAGALNPNEPEFWAMVHQVSSDIIRVSHLLEMGKLAPSIKDRLNPPKTPVAAPAQPAQGARGGGRLTDEQQQNLVSPGGREMPTEEDVPF